MKTALITGANRGIGLEFVKQLFDLIQLLRRHRFPISGARLAQELGVSLRNVNCK